MERSNFNPRAPCGARRRSFITTSAQRYFNPRAPCGARPCGSGATAIFIVDFNPRAPCGARRGVSLTLMREVYFNPRAPCGARPVVLPVSTGPIDFNPRAPCGARQVKEMDIERLYKFQSTRPVRGATPWGVVHGIRRAISIHAPRAGRDCW